MRYLSGADLLLTGSVSLEPKQVSISLILIQRKDGRIFFSEPGKLPAEPIFQCWADAASTEPGKAGQSRLPGRAGHRYTSFFQSIQGHPMATTVTVTPSMVSCPDNFRVRSHRTRV